MFKVSTVAPFYSVERVILTSDGTWRFAVVGRLKVKSKSQVECLVFGT